MRSVLFLLGLSASLFVEGCAAISSVEKVESKENEFCREKCGRKFLIKRDYQRNRSIERCQKRCDQSEQ